jgi:hypothetical protein
MCVTRVAYDRVAMEIRANEITFRGDVENRAGTLPESGSASSAPSSLPTYPRCAFRLNFHFSAILPFARTGASISEPLPRWCGIV